MFWCQHCSRQYSELWEHTGMAALGDRSWRCRVCEDRKGECSKPMHKNHSLGGELGGRGGIGHLPQVLPSWFVYTHVFCIYIHTRRYILSSWFGLCYIRCFRSVFILLLDSICWLVSSCLKNKQLELWFILLENPFSQVWVWVGEMKSKQLFIFLAWSFQVKCWISTPYLYPKESDTTFSCSLMLMCKNVFCILAF